MSYICKKCRRTRQQLKEAGRLNLVQGYEQCADCHGDLEHESVVEREDLWEQAKKMAIKHDDYHERVSTRDKEVIIKTPNAYKYLPQWYKDELIAGHKRIADMFRNLHEGYGDYNEIID